MGFSDSFANAYSAVAGVRQRQEQIDMARASDAQDMAIAERDFRLKEEAKAYERGQGMLNQLNAQRDRVGDDRRQAVQDYFAATDRLQQRQLALASVSMLPADDPMRILHVNAYEEAVKAQQELRGLATDYEDRLQGIDSALVRISMLAPPEGGDGSQAGAQPGAQAPAQDFSGENFERPMYYSPTDKPGDREAVRSVTNRMSMMSPGTATPVADQALPAADEQPVAEAQAPAADEPVSQPQHPLAREQMLASRAGVGGGEYRPDPDGAGPGKMVYKVYSDEEAEYAKERLDAAAKTFNFGTPLNAVVINEMKRLEKGYEKYIEVVGKRDRESGKASFFKKFLSTTPAVSEINDMRSLFANSGDEEAMMNLGAVINADESERKEIVKGIVADYENRAGGWDEDVAMWDKDRQELRRLRGLGALDGSSATERKASPSTSNAPPMGMKESDFYEWYATNVEPGASKSDEERRAKAQRARSAWVKYISGS